MEMSSPGNCRDGSPIECLYPFCRQRFRPASGVETKVLGCYSTLRHGVRRVVDRSLLTSGCSPGYRRARRRLRYWEAKGLAEEI